MHKYIDKDIRRDFSTKLSFDDVWDDFDRYGIHNILDEDLKDDNLRNAFYEESRYYLVEALYDDYIKDRVNYKSYIEHGMDARLLMALRKDALMPISYSYKEVLPFYEEHAGYDSPDDFHKLRMKYFSFLHKDFKDYEWQWYMLLRHFWGTDGSDIIINFEIYYADCDRRKFQSPEKYRVDFLRQNIPEDRLWTIV